jgi:tetratricopeptide (TPR) repeat protein
MVPSNDRSAEPEENNNGKKKNKARKPESNSPTPVRNEELSQNDRDEGEETESPDYLEVYQPKKFHFLNNFQFILKSLYSLFFESFTSRSFLRLVFLIGFLIVFFSFRFSLHGESKMYHWTIMENHVDALRDIPENSNSNNTGTSGSFSSSIESFIIRSLSYGQTHFWYFWKLVYPRYLCFDYGYYCIPMVDSIWDYRNGLTLVTYFGFLGFCYYSIATMKMTFFLGILMFFFPLLPALNIFLPVGTLLAERLLFVPSIGFCFLVGDLLTSVDGFRLFWKTLDNKMNWICENGDLWFDQLLLSSSSSTKKENKREARSIKAEKENLSKNDQLSPSSSTSSHSPTSQKAVRFNFLQPTSKNDKSKKKSSSSGNSSPVPSSSSPRSQQDNDDEVSIKKKIYHFPTFIFLLLPLLFSCGLRVIERNNDWKSEFNIYSSALQVCPHSIKALSNYAMLFMARSEEGTDKFEKSLDIAMNAFELHPGNPAATINAGVAAQRLNRFPESMELFEYATRHPLATKAFGYLGTTLFSWINLISNQQIKSYLREVCLQWINVSLSQGFAPPGILHIGGSVAMDAGNLPLAIEYYENAVFYALENKKLRQGSKDVPVEDDVNVAFTYNQIGNCYFTLENNTKAIEYYEKGLAYEPNNLPLLTNSAIVHRQLGDYQKAREILAKGMEVTKDRPSPALLNNFGSLEMAVKNYTAAYEYFNQAYLLIQEEKKGLLYMASHDGVDFRYESDGQNVEEVILNNMQDAKRSMMT